MAQTTVPLRAADTVRITIITDNSIDVLLDGSEAVRRFPLSADVFSRPLPAAKHGFSALIEVQRNSDHGQVLFDTGVSRRGFRYNLDALQIDPKGVAAVVHSHGHPDHAMGQPGLIERLGSRGLPLIVHPEAYLERKVVLPDGSEINRPPPRRADLQRENIEIVEEVGPALLVDGALLISGEMARTTAFEKGFAIHWARRDGAWEPDPLIRDDQCAIVNLRDKGSWWSPAAVMPGSSTSCATRRRSPVSSRSTRSSAASPSAASSSRRSSRRRSPRYVVPGHCTGWSATQQIALAMPNAYIPTASAPRSCCRVSGAGDRVSGIGCRKTRRRGLAVAPAHDIRHPTPDPRHPPEGDMFISVLVRRLRPGKSYEDFVTAWYPDKGFGFPGRGPLLAVNMEDEREILTVGFIDLPTREQVMAELERVAAQEAVRHDRIAEVIESTVVRGVYQVRDAFDFASDETVSRGRPAYIPPARN